MPVTTRALPVIKQGSDFSVALPLTSSTYSPSQVRFYCQIRRFSGGPLLADVTVSWDGNTLTFSLSSVKSAKIPSTGPLGSPNTNLWVYDVIAVLPDGSKQCILEGPVAVDPSVTQF